MLLRLSARPSRAAAVFCGSLLASALLLACNGDAKISGTRVAPPSADVSGSYTVTETDQQSVCAPVPELPAADLTEWWLYDWAGDGFPVRAPYTLRLSVTHAGSALTLVVLDLNGHALELPYSGTLAADGSFTATRTRQFDEGPRVGGTLFTVLNRLDLTGTFRTVGTSTLLEATATGTDEFRPTGTAAPGPPFTTCTYHFGWSATRVSP